MKNSKFTLSFYCTILLLVGSCSDDNPTTTNVPPPTFQDSVIKLYSPVNNSHFVAGDTIHHIWSKGYASSYTIYSSSDTIAAGWGFGFTVYDTTLSYVVDNQSFTDYWYIQPNYTVSNPERFRSETRTIFRN